QTEQERGQLRGGIAVGEISDRRAPVANGHVTDQSQCLGDEGHPIGRPALELALAHERSDGEDAVRLAQVVEIRRAVDVDEDARAREPEVQHGHEALTARQHLGGVAVTRQDLYRLRRAAGRVVLEGGGLHAEPPRLARRAAPSAISSSTRDGPRGARVTRTPNGASASSTALAIAAGGEMAPPSPMPLTPRGLRGDGNSRCTVSTSGTSIAVGTR